MRLATPRQFPTLLIATVAACTLVVLGHLLDLTTTLILFKAFNGHELHPWFAGAFASGNLMPVFIAKSLAIIAAIGITTYNWRMPSKHGSQAPVRIGTLVVILITIPLVWTPVIHNALEILR